MEDKINELKDKRDALIEDIAKLESTIAKLPTDDLSYDTFCTDLNTREAQLDLVEKEIELLTLNFFPKENETDDYDIRTQHNG